MLFVFLLCLLLGQGAISNEHHITSANDLIQFSKNVNNGTSYSGTTVFLDADIDFSGGLSEQQFEPIGKKVAVITSKERLMDRVTQSAALQ